VEGGKKLTGMHKILLGLESKGCFCSRIMLDDAFTGSKKMLSKEGVKKGEGGPRGGGMWGTWEQGGCLKKSF